MKNKLWQMLILLSAGFMLAVVVTALYDLGSYVYGTHTFWAAAIFPIMLFGICTLGVMAYGLYELYLVVAGVCILAYRWFFYPKFWGKKGLPGHQERGPFR